MGVGREESEADFVVWQVGLRREIEVDFVVGWFGWMPEEYHPTWARGCSLCCSGDGGIDVQR